MNGDAAFEQLAAGFRAGRQAAERAKSRRAVSDPGMLETLRVVRQAYGDHLSEAIAGTNWSSMPEWVRAQCRARAWRHVQQTFAIRLADAAIGLRRNEAAEKYTYQRSRVRFQHWVPLGLTFEADLPDAPHPIYSRLPHRQAVSS